MNTVSGDTSAGLLRRFAAMVYDSLLLLGLFTLIALAFVVLAPGASTAYTRPLLQLALTLALVAFFVWFWTHGGQTLGMRSWRLRLISASGDPVSLRQAVIRILLASVSWGCLGLGYLWMFVDRERLAWHDRGSGTRVVVVPRRN